MKSPRIAIFVHIFHMGEANKIEKYISNVPYSFDLYINFAVNEKNKSQVKEVTNRYSKKYLTRFYPTVSPNRGMDPGGFIVSANLANKMKKKYDYICKIHTKKGDGPDTNPFYVDGKTWSLDLFETVLGSESRVREIINIFQENRDVGLISCADYLCGEMGSNMQRYKEYVRGLNIKKKAAFPYAQNFIAGTIFWVRGTILDFFKKNLCTLDLFEETPHPIPRDGTLAHVFERLFSAIIRHQGYTIFLLPTKKIKSKKPKIISFYFPQYHQSLVNDHLWGKGFTEWDNLKKAKPKIKGQKLIHPHKDMGYYDLGNKETRKLQGELAKAHGIHGFCYHHYWFSGRKVLYKPLEAMLNDGYPDLPFCLNWANEPWTKNWSGEEEKILLPQHYGGINEWDTHFFYLLNFFKHPNYIIINNKPVFLFYRAGHIQNIRELCRWWNTRAIENGFAGMYFIQCLGSFQESNKYLDCMDGVCEFQPNLGNETFLNDDVKEGLMLANDHDSGDTYSMLDLEKIYQNITFAKGRQDTVVRWIPGKIWSEPSFRTKVQKSNQDYYNGFFPSWDNTPRRQSSVSTIILDRSPENYKLYLTKQIYNTVVENNPNSDEKLMFMNSWNEWGEGCVMEPDHIRGNKILDGTKEAMDNICKYFIKDEDEQ